MSKGKGQQNIYVISQNEAKYNTLLKTDISFFEKICQWYSQTFHTPLHLVREGTQVLWADVLRAYYFHFTQKMEYNDLYDDVETTFFPPEEDNTLMERLLKEQEHQLNKLKLAKLLKPHEKQEKSQSYKGELSDNPPSSATQNDEVIINKTYDDSPPEDL
jgi:hypothetical protein